MKYGVNTLKEEKDLFVEIRLLGNCQILVNRKPINTQKGRIAKPWQVFCRLASEGHDWVAADILMEEFWPDKGYSKANNSLKNAVLLLREEIRQVSGHASAGCVESLNGGYQLSEHVQVSSDIVDFYQISRQITQAGENIPIAESFSWYQELARLYQGGLVYRPAAHNWLSEFAGYIDRIFATSMDRCFEELYKAGMHHQIVVFYEVVSRYKNIPDSVSQYWRKALATLDNDRKIPSFSIGPEQNHQESQMIFYPEPKSRKLLEKIKKDLFQQEKKPYFIPEYSKLIQYCTGNLSRFAITLFSFESLEQEQSYLEESIELFNRMAISALRGSDIVAPYSKNSVLVILPNHSVGSSAVVRRRLCDSFALQKRNILLNADITAIGNR